MRGKKLGCRRNGCSVHTQTHETRAYIYGTPKATPHQKYRNIAEESRTLKICLLKLWEVLSLGLCRARGVALRHSATQRTPQHTRPSEVLIKHEKSPTDREPRTPSNSQKQTNSSNKQMRSYSS